MGTRGFYGFVKDGKVKGMYNHHDSYPGGLGFDVVTFVKNTSVEEMNTIFDELVEIKDGVPPTEEEIEKYKIFADPKVSTGKLTEWYVLLRNAQGDLDAFKRGLRHFENAEDFPKDSLFCEWAYLIDLDDNTLKVLEGFNLDKDSQYELFKIEEGSSSLYYGCSLLIEFPLDEIGVDWDNQITAKLKGQEDEVESTLPVKAHEGGCK